jgi:hypothetical protein
MDTLTGLFDWPHVLLLGGATVGGALVGIGVLKESEKWSIAALMVLGGLILEPILLLACLYTMSSKAERSNQKSLHWKRLYRQEL